VSSLRNVSRDVLNPVREGVDDAFRPVRNIFGGVTDYGDLKDENADLKRRVANLEGRLDRERAVGTKVGELEKLLDLPTAEDATGIAARVVGTAAGNFERTVEINKGTADGVFVGQPVVAGNGLVGKVTRSSSATATVTLLDSPGLGVGVRLENTNVRGLTEPHTGERNILLKFLGNGPAGVPLRKCADGQSKDTCITIGERVFTAAVEDAAFPPDLTVGRITKIFKARTDLESTIEVRPVVNLDDLTYVKVLRWPELKSKSNTTTETTSANRTS
jgi:rod shape-determining protein MreC